MADDLGDEWWLTEDIDEEQVQDTEKRKKEKRPLEKKDEQEEGATQKKKRKKKPKKIVDMQTTEATAASVWTFLERELKVTSLELEEIKPGNDGWFSPSSSDDANNLSHFLMDVIPKWKKYKKKVGEMKGSPVLLIVCSSGQRAADLIRMSQHFKGEDCKTAKLFAKHFKVSEQEKFLQQNIVHMCVGTPNRISKLLETGSLLTDHLKHVVVDWRYADVKKRSISTMPDVRNDLAVLLQKHVFPILKEGSAKLSLF